MLPAISIQIDSLADFHDNYFVDFEKMEYQMDWLAPTVFNIHEICPDIFIKAKESDWSAMAPSQQQHTMIGDLGGIVGLSHHPKSSHTPVDSP